MICVDFLQKSSGQLVGFRISGHSGFASAGTDIVCAAVSSAAYMAVNTVTDILKAEAQVWADDGEMYLRIASKDISSCRVLLEGLKLHLIGLEEQYPKAINVSYTEV